MLAVGAGLAVGVIAALYLEARHPPPTVTAEIRRSQPSASTVQALAACCGMDSFRIRLVGQRWLISARAQLGHFRYLPLLARLQRLCCIMLRVYEGTLILRVETRMGGHLRGWVAPLLLKPVDR
jgi:hypothetical protein